MMFAAFIAGMAWGGVSMLLIILRRFDLETKKPYRLVCRRSGCNFQIKSNDPMPVLIEMMDQHERQHLHE